MSQQKGKTQSTLPTKIGVLLFPEFEPLDTFGPIEAFQSLSWRTKLDLYVINATMDPVSNAPAEPNRPPTGSKFEFRVVPTHTYDTVPDDLEVLLIPGGRGAYHPSEATAAFVAKTYPKLKYLITVCNGAAIAAKAGVLDGKRATTNKLLWASVTAMGPDVQWVKTARYVVDGNVWTAGGVSAGIDVACGWIAEVFGRGMAREVANAMEYEWRDDPSWDPFSYMFSAESVNVKDV